jgi:hypothetical protein
MIGKIKPYLVLITRNKGISKKNLVLFSIPGKCKKTKSIRINKFIKYLKLKMQ